MFVSVEKLDTGAYRIKSEIGKYVMAPTNAGRHRWGLWWEGDTHDDALVLLEADTEKEMLAEAVIYALG